jgi:hypothetical protein
MHRRTAAEARTARAMLLLLPPELLLRAPAIMRFVHDATSSSDVGVAAAAAAVQPEDSGDEDQRAAPAASAAHVASGREAEAAADKAPSEPSPFSRLGPAGSFKLTPSSVAITAAAASPTN